MDAGIVELDFAKTVCCWFIKAVSRSMLDVRTSLGTVIKLMFWILGL